MPRWWYPGLAPPRLLRLASWGRELRARWEGGWVGPHQQVDRCEVCGLGASGALPTKPDPSLGEGLTPPRPRRPPLLPPPHPEGTPTQRGEGVAAPFPLPPSGPAPPHRKDPREAGRAQGGEARASP